MTQTVDEAVKEAISGMRSTMENFRTDFREHLEDDRRVWKQVDQWSGGIKLAGWSLGLGIPAILAVVSAYVIKHW